MPEPALTFGVVKFIWDESRSVRAGLWRKLPFAKDAVKREFAEQELGALLDDASKLAKNLSPDQADEAIEKRSERFRTNLLGAKIPPDQVATLVDRASVMVRILVTEPVSEITGLRLRMAEMESALSEMETAIERQRSVSEELAARLRGQSQDRSVLALWVGFGVLGLLEIVQLVVLLIRSGGGNH